MASKPPFVTLWSYRKIPYVFDAGFPFQNDVLEAMDKFPFQVAGAQYFYGQNLKEKNWFIQSLIKSDTLRYIFS